MGLYIPLLLSIIMSQLLVKPYLNQGIVVTALLVGILSLAALLAFLVRTRWKLSSRKTHSLIAGALETLRAQNEKTRNLHLASQTLVMWAIKVTSISWVFRSVSPMFLIIDACALIIVLSLAIEASRAPAGLNEVEAAVMAYLHQSLFHLPL